MTQAQPLDQADTLAEDLHSVRQASVEFCARLQTEDYGLQAMPETSPPKWHLAHTSWFFETFILQPYAPAYRPFNPAFASLFNSYYNGIGARHARAERGILSRPGVSEILHYRSHVDEHLATLLADSQHPQRASISERVQLGIHHEQQHQELFFTDIKYSFSRNPLFPAYCEQTPTQAAPAAAALQWRQYKGGEADIGYRGSGFCFDNEQPAHRVLLQPYALGSRPVSNAEYLEFMQDQGYQRPELWLSDGWTTVTEQGWQAPLYWLQRDGQWWQFTLYGLQPLNLAEPVCHVSAYEADAYARWADARLPTEFEWEHAARQQPVTGQLLEAGLYHPQMHTDSLYGSVWQWTSSAYGAYPGYRPAGGAIGEYNGKFMANQLVLRGGSCVTSADHIRATYRNFFYPPDRWQFSGIRLAQWL